MTNLLLDAAAGAQIEARADQRVAERRDKPAPLAAVGEQSVRHDIRLSVALFAVALGYATLRYNVFKGVPWPDWPAYTVNKALAVASLLLITASVLRLARRRGGTAVLLASAGVLALAHSLLSFALFNPLYYARLFESGKLTALAGLSITLGAAAMAGLELGARKAGNWPAALRFRSLGLLAFAGGLHAALPALSTWFDPSTWPGGLPPITLISFLAGAVGLAALYKTPAK